MQQGHYPPGSRTEKKGNIAVDDSKESGGDIKEKNSLVPLSVQHGVVDLSQVVVLLKLLDGALGHAVGGSPTLVRVQVIPTGYTT